MRKLLALVMLLCAVPGALAAVDDIELLVKDIVVAWGGGGGKKDLDANSFTYSKYAENYWDIHDLSTDVYPSVRFTFRQPVAYDKVRLTAVYSDDTQTMQTFPKGTTDFTLPFDQGKTLVKLFVSHSWDVPEETVTLFFNRVIIRAKDSTGNVSGMPVKSPKLGTGVDNPLVDYAFCADPTAIEHEGRLYVYGTNDHQQYEAGSTTNMYEKIKSLVMLSTDDMVNWTYHGLIPVGEIAPWIGASWAPSIISRRQPDGSTLFALYFSNSGWGTGVLHATSPVGPWTSPLNASLIDGSNPVVAGSGAIFDPGATVDDNGDAWLTFGATQGWLAKLNPDLHSFATTPIKLNTPFHFEANELNYIGGKYVYTYNTDWTDHSSWPHGGTVPTACSMIYYTTETPLVASSWSYGDCYFRNPGEHGMNYGNNHTHLQKYQGKWYLFYHTNLLQPSLTTDGGFRSIYVDEIAVDEATATVSECTPTHQGVSAIRHVDPQQPQSGAMAAATLGILYQSTPEAGHMVASVGTPSITAPAPDEGIIEVRAVDIPAGADIFEVRVKGTGTVTLRLTDRNAPDAAIVTSSGGDWTTLTAPLATKASGPHTVYIVITGTAQLDTWRITSSSSLHLPEADPAAREEAVYDLHGHRLPTATTPGIYIIGGRKVMK